jgi:pimeloyl-ACP methyl ester carboxylesterase
VALISTRTRGANIIVYVCHGRLRALDRESVEQWAIMAGDEGVSVVLHNYPGYGGTPGPVTEARLCGDALQLAEHILCQEWALGQELVVLGNSIGCGPAMWVAVQPQLHVKRTVLVSPYASLCPLMPYWLLSYVTKALGVRIPSRVATWLEKPERLQAIQGGGWDPFPPIKLARRLEKGAEVLILHGAEDSTVPVSHAKVSCILLCLLIILAQRGVGFAAGATVGRGCERKAVRNCKHGAQRHPYQGQ